MPPRRRRTTQHLIADKIVKAHSINVRGDLTIGTSLRPDVLGVQLSTLLADALHRANAPKTKSLLTQSFIRRVTWESHDDLIAASLRDHQVDIRDWAQRIKHFDMHGDRQLGDTYVSLELKAATFRGIRQKDSNRTVTEADLLGNSSHCVVFGDPGSGKTTLVKKLITLSSEKSPGYEPYEFTLLIKCRELERGSGIAEAVLDTLGLKSSLVPESSPAAEEADDQELLAELRHHCVTHILQSRRILLLIDGLDECPNAMGMKVQVQLQKLVRKHLRSVIVVTTRLAVLHTPWANTVSYRIQPLTDPQKYLFSQQWFRRNEKALEFLNLVNNSTVFEALDRPLNLVHLCLLYSQYGYLPDRPLSCIRGIIRLHLDGWNRQNDLTRVSKYGRFDPTAKMDFLSALSYRRAVRDTKGRGFPRAWLEEVYQGLHSAFGLPSNECEQVAKEIESHTGLLVESDYELYEFSHRCLEEVLAGEFILKSPVRAKLGPRLFRMPDACAVATALSTDPMSSWLELIDLYEILARTERLVPTDAGDVEEEGEEEWLGGFLPQVKPRDTDAAGFWPRYLARLASERVGFPDTIDSITALLWVGSVWAADQAWVANKGIRLLMAGCEGSNFGTMLRTAFKKYRRDLVLREFDVNKQFFLLQPPAETFTERRIRFRQRLKVPAALVAWLKR